MTYAEKYRYAIDRAAYYDNDCRKDIVHDAWIKYFNHTGCDLFEIPINNFKGYCFKLVRTAFYKWYYRERKGPNYRYFDAEELASNMVAPDEAITGRDLYGLLEKRLLEAEVDYLIPGKSAKRNEFRKRLRKERLVDIFRLRAAGYNGTDIADELKISNGLVTKYTKKMTLINPFNGSKLKISRTITKDIWDKKTDKEDYEVEDFNEYMELYRHKESKQGLLVRLPAQKTNPYIR